MARTHLALALLATLTAVATVGLPAASASGHVRGEPRYHAALPTITAPPTQGLSATQLGLIRVGARANDPAVVAQALGDRHSTVVQSSTATRLVQGHGFAWGWASALALAAVAALGITAYALSRRTTRNVRPAPQP